MLVSAFRDLVARWARFKGLNHFCGSARNSLKDQTDNMGCGWEWYHNPVACLVRNAPCLPPLQWDPMITTLPGLYLVSVGAVKPAAWLLGWTGSVVCSVGMLRFVNLLFSAGNLYLLYLLLSKIHQKNKVQSKRNNSTHSHKQI